ncbi:MAG: hypothetical protein WCO65_03095 [bacterium]
MEDFFHAYVIGGHKEDAKAFVNSFLEKFGVVHDNSITTSEHVIFTIDHVRELRHWQQLVSQNGEKIYIAYISFITNEAQNALLKTLEEPVPHTHIIIAIPKPEMLLPTLLSRVQVIIPEKSERSGSQKIKDFLKLSIADKLEFVKKLTEKGDDEYASAEVREKAVAFFDDLEHYFAENISEVNSKNIEKVESILKLKKYLYSPAASTKSILETVVLSL